MSVFRPTFAQLPGSLSVFPLSGVLLLPGGRLPLNIFEPRYLAMVHDALAGDRLIGMIQPVEMERRADMLAGSGHPPLARVGCAGRIVAFSETDDGRYLITLAGLCRFSWLGEETLTAGGYRRGRVDWSAYAADMAADAVAPSMAPDRDALLAALKVYFRREGMEADWSVLDSLPLDRMVTMLAMVCPFAPSEKQALLEAPDGGQRAAMLLALVEMAAHDDGGGDDAARH